MANGRRAGYKEEFERSVYAPYAPAGLTEQKWMLLLPSKQHSSRLAMIRTADA